MERNPCPHEWRQQSVEIAGRSTPVARWVCDRCDDATDADPGATSAAPWERRKTPTFRGSGSWTLRSDDDGRLDAVVYLRDAWDLPRGADALDPPPWRGAADPVTWPGGEDSRAAAGQRWSGWWRALVTGPEAAPGPGAPPGDLGPELGAAVRELWPLATAATQGRRHPGAHRTPVDPDLLARVVDDVAFDRGVEPATLHGRLRVLDVRGAWWALTAPGAALASRAALADPRAAQVVLRAVFESGLGRTRER